MSEQGRPAPPLGIRPHTSPETRDWATELGRQAEITCPENCWLDTADLADANGTVFYTWYIRRQLRRGDKVTLAFQIQASS